MIEMVFVESGFLLAHCGAPKGGAPNGGALKGGAPGFGFRSLGCRFQVFRVQGVGLGFLGCENLAKVGSAESRSKYKNTNSGQNWQSRFGQSRP